MSLLDSRYKIKMEDWDEEDLESEEEDESEEEAIIDESEEDIEPLEEIIQETPAASYPKQKWPNSGSSITPEFSQPQAPLETGLQDIQTPPTQEPQMAENAPEYSSITYQEPTNQRRSQTEEGYPEQIHIGSQSFSPSLPQHLMSSQFSTLPRMINQRNMQGEPEQIKPQEKKYESNFEQNKRDRRRF